MKGNGDGHPKAGSLPAVIFAAICIDDYYVPNWHQGKALAVVACKYHIRHAFPPPATTLRTEALFGDAIPCVQDAWQAQQVKKSQKEPGPLSPPASVYWSSCSAQQVKKFQGLWIIVPICRRRQDPVEVPTTSHRTQTSVPASCGGGRGDRIETTAQPVRQQARYLPLTLGEGSAGPGSQPLDPGETLFLVIRHFWRF